MGIITCGKGITRIESDADHRCQTFLHKIETMWSKLRFAWPKYKADLKRCLTKIISISKLRIILMTNIMFSFFNYKMQNALQASATESLRRTQGILCKFPIYIFILTFLNKKCNYYLFMKIFNYQVLIISLNR